jgi:competence protein ComGF
LPQLLRLFKDDSDEAKNWAIFWNQLSTELQDILISNAVKANPKQIAEDIVSKTFEPGDIQNTLTELLNTYIENFDLTSK